MHQWLIPICLLQVFLSVMTAGSACGASNPAAVADAVKITEQLNTQVGLDGRFFDHTGAEVALADVLDRGQPVVLTPVYYRCPRLCGLFLDGIVNVLGQTKLKLGTDFQLVTFSFNHREPSSLAEKKRSYYHKAAGLTPSESGSWDFLTASRKQIVEIMTELGYGFAEDGEEFLHAAAAIVLTPEGRISRYLYGIQFEPRDFDFALIEAGGGRVGSTLDKVLLYCFRFDETTGRYTPAILRITRLVAMLVVLLLAGLMIYLRLSERRQATAEEQIDV